MVRSAGAVYRRRFAALVGVEQAAGCIRHAATLRYDRAGGFYCRTLLFRPVRFVCWVRAVGSDTH